MLKINISIYIQRERERERDLKDEKLLSINLMKKNVNIWGNRKVDLFIM